MLFDVFSAILAIIIVICGLIFTNTQDISLGFIIVLLGYIIYQNAYINFKHND